MRSARCLRARWLQCALVRGPARRPAGWAGWTEVIAGADGTRLVSCNVFGRFVVVEQRREAATQLRVID